VFHKSLKSNANLEKSPTRTLRAKNNLSPFALCRKLLINAERSAYNELL